MHKHDPSADQDAHTSSGHDAACTHALRLIIRCVSSLGGGCKSRPDTRASARTHTLSLSHTHTHTHTQSVVLKQCMQPGRLLLHDLWVPRIRANSPSRQFSRHDSAQLERLSRSCQAAAPPCTRVPCIEGEATPCTHSLSAPADRVQCQPTAGTFIVDITVRKGQCKSKAQARRDKQGQCMDWNVCQYTADQTAGKPKRQRAWFILQAEAASQHCAT